MIQYIQSTFLLNHTFPIDPCNSFTPTPFSSSTTPKSRSTPSTPVSRLWKHDLETNSYFSRDSSHRLCKVQPLLESQLLLWTSSSTFRFNILYDQPWHSLQLQHPQSNSSHRIKTKNPSVHQTEQTRMGNQQTKTQGQRRTRLLTSDRLAKQPFYTLWVLIRSLLPDDEKGPRGQLQSIPRPRRFGQTRLLLLLPLWHRSPTSWTFNSLEDLCVCVIFVISQHLQDIRTIGKPHLAPTWTRPTNSSKLSLALSHSLAGSGPRSYNSTSTSTSLNLLMRTPSSTTTRNHSRPPDFINSGHHQ